MAGPLRRPGRPAGGADRRPKKKIGGLTPLPSVAALVRDLVATRRVPTATYRLQFHKDFSFADAAVVVPYLHRLGITDAYASPVLLATPGSGHGYDICDPTRVNPELGGEAGLDAFAAALRAYGLGLVLDTVPNHMGIAHPCNRWWADVLENGPSSRHADTFDIDWEPVNPRLHGKVLLPILGEQYGAALEGGVVTLHYEAGGFYLAVYHHRLPVAPRTYADILTVWLDGLAAVLGEGHEHLEEYRSILTALHHLPPRTSLPPEKVAERYREKEIIKRRLHALVEASPAVRQAVEAGVREVNGTVGVPHSFDRLDALIEAQSYRPAYWRVATEEINYRRFFDINELAAIRTELPEVFEATHALTLRLLAEGKATGLRIDHPDGLWDPTGYFRRLQESYARARVRGRYAELGLSPPPDEAVRAAVAALGNGPGLLYVVAEKILGEGEPLPVHWLVDGTTGYDFLNDVNGLFVARENRDALDRTYRAFTGEAADLRELVNSRKKMIMLVSMASELNALAHRLDRIAERNRHYRDFTLYNLTFAVREVVAALPIYRTYVTPDGVVSPRDRRFIEEAVAEAKARNPRTAEAVFDFLRDTLLLDNLDRFRPEDRPRLVEWVLRFQQLTGPVMAKGVEDTVFYVYNRLVALNEVGGHPDRFGVTPTEFHARNAERRTHWPHALLATTTHDTKRSEDTRARLDVLSELPGEWDAALDRWGELHAELVTRIEGRPAPSANDRYLFYQTVVAAWPPGELSAEAFAAFRRRVADYMAKATKEAKARTSWVNPHEGYDAAVQAFVARALPDDPGDPFRRDAAAFAKRLAFFGYVNSLAQQLLKLTCPGVPDLYQGTELWDFSLVDPDNRRPVDYALRQHYLEELAERVAAADDCRATLAAELMAAPDDGRVKLYVTWQSLAFRREHRALFAEGDYQPLAATGERADHVVAFSRSHGTERVVAAACVRAATLTGGAERLPVGTEVWGDGRLPLPGAAVGERWRDVFTAAERTVDKHAGQAGLWLRDVFGVLPVALLERAGGGT